MATTNIQSFAGQVEVTSNLTVDTSTLHVDSVSNRVGMGTTLPVSNLHVVGNVYATSNITTASNVLIQGTAAATSKTTGALQVAGGVGVQGALYGDAATFSGALTGTSGTFTGDVRIPTLSTSVIGKITPVYVRGTGQNNNGNRLVKIGNTTHVNTNTRGLTLTIITASTHAHVSSTNYDTHGSTTDSNNLATALESMTDNQIGILTSYDAFEGAMTDNLVTACYKLGLTRLAKARNTTTRHPYCAIFYGPGASSVAGNHAIEVLKSTEASSAYATISTFLVDDSFIGQTVTNALYSGNGNDTTPSLIVDKDTNVGIGTAAPSAKLHVVGNVYATSNITTASNVLIQGTAAATSKTTGALQVVGGVGVQGALYGDAATFSGAVGTGALTATTGAFSSNLAVDTNVLFVDTVADRVGMGTTAPSAKLHVVLNSETGSSNTVGLVIQNMSSDYTSIANGFGSRIQFKTNRGTDSTAILPSADIKGYIYTGAGGTTDYHALDLDVYGDNVSLNRGISILSKSNTGGPADTIVHGNLGIGTASPSSNLHVVGNVYATSNITTDSNVLIQGTAAATSKTTGALQVTGGVGVQGALYGDAATFSGAVGTGALTATSVTTDDYLIHTGDTDTKVGFPANDTFTVTTANSERLRVNSSGNVGIGTASPNSLLHVNGQLTYGTYLVSTGSTQRLYTSGSTTNWIQLQTAGTSTNDILDIQANNGSATIKTRNNQPLLLNSSGGNVGIGTASPSSNLHVVGNVYATSNITTASNVLIQGTAAATSKTTGALQVVGGVGISGALYGDAATFSGAVGTGALTATSVTTNDYLIHTGDTDTKVGFPANDTFTVTTSGTERVRVDSVGRVGIGTTNPAYPLHIQQYDDGDSVFNFTIDQSNDATVYYRKIAYVSNNNGHVIIRGSIGSHLQSEGNGFIDVKFAVREGFTALGSCYGTINNTNIIVKDNTGSGRQDIYLVTGLYSLANLQITTTQGCGIFRDNENAPTSTAPSGTTTHDLKENFTTFRVKDNGNVGIGTTSPQNLFHMYGGGSSTLRVETDTGQAQLLLRSGQSIRRACRIDFSRADTGTLYASIIGDYAQNATDDLTLGTSGGGRIMTLTQGGNVGIGTTSPINRLDVRGDSYATFGKATNAAAGWSGIRLGTPYTTNHDAYCSVIESYNDHTSNYNSELRFKTSNGDNAAATEHMRITSSGNVGIGTAQPIYKLTLPYRAGIQSTAAIVNPSSTEGHSSFDLGTLYGHDDVVTEAIAIYRPTAQTSYTFKCGYVQWIQVKVRGQGTQSGLQIIKSYSYDSSGIAVVGNGNGTTTINVTSGVPDISYTCQVFYRSIGGQY